MKKLLFMAMLLVGAMNAKADDNITGTLKVASDKQTAVLSVSLTNAADYVAFQMDVALPAGWTVNSSELTASSRLQNSGTVNLSSVGGDAAESTSFTLASNVIGGNTVRVIGYNLGNATISNNDGEIFHIKLTKSGDAAAAVTAWTATFSNVDFVTKTNLQEIAVAVSNADNKVTGEADATVLLGDANGDGKITLGDVVLTMNYATASDKSTFTNFVFDNANIIKSSPEAITLADVVAILLLTM